ncbi:MAG: choice-of-anchor B family protein, partial [Phycisphaerae bacterium]
QTLENPTLATTFTNGLGTIDHNMMVRGNFLYEANYSSGLRVFDITDVMAITEVGFFDTRPEDNGLNFNGAWGVFTAFPSGIVTLSDRDRGLFVFDVSAITRPVAIPTVSEWGMIVLAACVFTIGAVLASRRRESPPHGTNPYPR